MKLTPKQKAFADNYIETGNATEAYLKAYNCKRETADTNGTRLLGNARIKQYIEERMQEKEPEKIASQDEVLSFLTNVMRGQVTEQVPITMKDYWEMTEKDPSIKDRVKAAELLGKRHMLWTDKQQIDTTQQVVIVNDLSDLDE